MIKIYIYFQKQNVCQLIKGEVVFYENCKVEGYKRKSGM